MPELAASGGSCDERSRSPKYQETIPLNLPLMGGPALAEVAAADDHVPTVVRGKQQVRIIQR
jgi:hypothetical protein